MRKYQQQQQQERLVPTNHILQGDCVQEMACLPSGCVDFMLTDPPYLTNYHDRSGRTVQGDGRNNGQLLRDAFREMYRILKKDRFCVSFYGWNQADQFIRAWREAGFRLVGHIAFPKDYVSKTGMMRYTHENAYLLAKGYPREPEHPIPDVIPWTVYTGNKLHPTQKPVEILKPLIQSFSQPGDLIVDPFCGSASTCIAARMLGRQYLGIEVEEQYVRVARARLAALDKKLLHHHERVVPFRESEQVVQRQRSSYATSSAEPTRSRGGGGRYVAATVAPRCWDEW